ncbi:hypothetical protein [Marinobacter changyiensis]|uniref:hypothetical protein n=1 Tax=Marinobacter changyiensis TaxID=2604091 RepID=UPI0015D31EFA|nr:hypothetical protein [Marinobacter changyiensis]
MLNGKPGRQTLRLATPEKAALTQVKSSKNSHNDKECMMVSVAGAPEADFRTQRSHMNALQRVMEDDDQGQ